MDNLRHGRTCQLSDLRAYVPPDLTHKHRGLPKAGGCLCVTLAMLTSRRQRRTINESADTAGLLTCSHELPGIADCR